MGKIFGIDDKLRAFQEILNALSLSLSLSLTVTYKRTSNIIFFQNINPGTQFSQKLHF